MLTIATLIATGKLHMLKFACILPLIVYGSGCSNQPEQATRRLPVKGEVVYLYRDAQRVVIRHEAVPGWSPAALTEIPVRDEAEYRKLKVGQRVTATIVVGGTSEYLERIEITGTTSDQQHRP